MLIACNYKGKRILAEEATKKDEQGNPIKYYCPLCETEVVLKKGIKKIDHFSHKEQTEICKLNGLHGESIQHMYMKKIIKQIIETDNNTLFSELEWKIENRIADYYFEIKHEEKIKKIAVEVVHKHYDLDDYEYKNKDYLKRNIHVIWIFDMDYLFDNTGTIKEYVNFKPIMKENQKINSGYTYFLNIHNQTLYTIRRNKYKGTRKTDGYYKNKIETFKIEKFIRKNNILLAKSKVKKFWNTKLYKPNKTQNIKEIPYLKEEDLIKKLNELGNILNKNLSKKIKEVDHETAEIYIKNYELLKHTRINEEFLENILLYWSKEDIIPLHQTLETIKIHKRYLKEQKIKEKQGIYNDKLNTSYHEEVKTIGITIKKENKTNMLKEYFKKQDKNPIENNINNKEKQPIKTEHEKCNYPNETTPPINILQHITTKISYYINDLTIQTQEEQTLIETYNTLEKISQRKITIKDEEIPQYLEWNNLQQFVKKEILTPEDFGNLHRIYIEQKYKQ